ncbi:MAG: hypothetical protein ACHQHN_00850 [Sphingobacteriales bacterium]
MKNILIFNDNSPEAEHAMELASFIAGKANVSLYVWNTFEDKQEAIAADLIALDSNENPAKQPGSGRRSENEKPGLITYTHSGLKPNLVVIEDVVFDSNHVLSLVQKFNIGLLIKGIAGNRDHNSFIERSILNCSTKSGCPILLIPQGFRRKNIEKIVYTTDLRFCRQDIVRFLSKLAVALNASVLIANIAAKGLPYMDNKYALNIFEDVIVDRSNCDHIYFSNIRERDVSKTLDILINDMKNDLLVLVNHKYHFNEILGRDVPYTLPEFIQVPILIFPS